MAAKTQTRKRPSPGATGGRRKSCHFCKDKVLEVDYKNVNQLRRYVSEKGRSATAASPAHAAATSGRFPSQ